MSALCRQIKTAIILVLKLCLRLFPYRFIIYLKNKSNSLYSIWICLQINKCGSKVHFTSVAYLKGNKFIEIGNNTSFGKDLYLTAWKFDYSSTYPIIKIDDEINGKVRDLITVRMINAIKIEEKLKRQEKIDELKEEVRETFKELYKENSDLDNIINQVNEVLETIEYEEIRRLITDEKIRPDGRQIDEIRPLSSEVDILPRTHGSAMFTRGQTQVLSVTTLGSLNEYQILDGLSDEEGKRFMHHYNFPQFSVGETGRYGAPGRREIGHGALGEKALLRVLPSEEEFPYTIRVVSEVLESNGSSSQASICAGCMSLMAAGVPLKSMVAGIAMGLITNGDKYTILTDIQGAEDHFGDMDFKVAGTEKGICALQMDIKIKGITKQILKEALEQAKKARLEVLANMKTAIAKPREELSKYAPKIKQMKIKEEKIKDVIGRGGEVITKIIQDASGVISVNDKNAVKIDIEDDGRIILYHSDYAVIDKAMKLIEDAVREVEEGELYTVKVVKIIEAGCFVEVWPGCEGFVHISKLAKERVKKCEDVVKVGDEIVVKAIGTDNKGRINFSRKDAM